MVRGDRKVLPEGRLGFLARKDRVSGCSTSNRTLPQHPIRDVLRIASIFVAVPVEKWKILGMSITQRKTSSRDHAFEIGLTRTHGIDATPSPAASLSAKSADPVELTQHE